MVFREDCALRHSCAQFLSLCVVSGCGAIDSVLACCSEVYACFEQGIKQEAFSKTTQAFVLSLLQTCRGKTQYLAQPCGECDMYKDIRSVCQADTSIRCSNLPRGLSRSGLTVCLELLGESELGSESFSMEACGRET